MFTNDLKKTFEIIKTFEKKTPLKKSIGKTHLETKNPKKERKMEKYFLKKKPF